MSATYDCRQNNPRHESFRWTSTIKHGLIDIMPVWLESAATSNEIRERITMTNVRTAFEALATTPTAPTGPLAALATSVTRLQDGQTNKDD